MLYTINILCLSSILYPLGFMYSSHLPLTAQFMSILYYRYLLYVSIHLPSSMEFLPPDENSCSTVLVAALCRAAKTSS